MKPDAAQSLEPRLQQTLNHSQKEAVAASAMTSTSDNFMNPFALHLGASNLQMGLLTGIPQLVGSLIQLLSVWLGTWISRKNIVLASAMLQTAVMLVLATLAILQRPGLATSLIMLVMLYHATSNLIQPQWRAWMGSLVPQKQRGRFFASRNKRTIATSLATFLAGGVLLWLSERYAAAWAGFFFLFMVSAIGRAVSCYFLWCMHDPTPLATESRVKHIFETFPQLRQSLHDATFRTYTLFLAGMHATVAISGPFFAVYLLEELQYSYIEFTITMMAAIATQFVMLRFWGSVSDHHGNRLIMILSSVIIPIVPFLWLVSDNYFWLLGTQLLSGISWSGFNLTTGNYLYDIRPHHSDFATYAAVQAGITSILVFFGSVAGGYIAQQAPALNDMLPLPFASALFIVFLVSGLARFAVLLWFIPRAEEPHIRTRPQLLKIIFRIARYNSISGVQLDYLTVTEKEEELKELHKHHDPQSPS